MRSHRTTEVVSLNPELRSQRALDRLCWRVLGLLTLPALLAGCSPPDDTAVPAVVGDPDAAWIHEGELATPEWTADDVGATLQALDSQPFPMPGAVFQNFEGVMSHGDSRCPGPELTFEAILGCTTDSGWFYAGIAGYGATDLAEGANTFIQDDVYADMQVLSPDGPRFAIGGSANQHLGTNSAGVRSYSGFLDGIFIYTNGSLFDPAVDALIEYTAGERTDGGRWVGLDGAIGFGGSYLMFDDVVIGGETCPEDTTGSVRIRDATQHWYTVALGDDCDGCGTVYFNGTEAIGTTCVSFDQLVNNLAITLLEPWR